MRALDAAVPGSRAPSDASTQPRSGWMPTRPRYFAEAYQSMVEERPWRPSLTQSEAARVLCEDVRAGRLDSRAAEAVLEVTGQPRAGRREVRSWPAGLTDREVDVLRVLARGRSNRDAVPGDPSRVWVSEARVHQKNQCVLTSEFFLDAAGGAR